jgi:Ion channel
MIGVLWTFLYGIVDRASAQSFAMRGSITALDFTDVIYFSFATLTTTSYGDIVPLTRAARMASVVEGIIGQLFLAILIAKLVGVYPPRREETSAQ